MNQNQMQEIMAQYLRAIGIQGNNNQYTLSQYPQNALPQQIVGFGNPQISQGGMGSGQNMLVPQNGVIR